MPQDTTQVRGWVYVITNKAMPGLVKVGFSTKDPALRARELGSTGVPHPYTVAYDALVRGPKRAERSIHERLSHLHDGKEWFKCSVEVAVSAIKAVVAEGALLEAQNIDLEKRRVPPEALQTSLGQDATAASPQSKSHASGGTTTRTLRTIATYAGQCTSCGQRFSVTLTRYDTVARCPHCLRASDVSAFLKSEIIL